MRRLFTGLSSIGLVMFGIVVSAAGVIYPFGAAANNGPGSGQITAGMIAFGALVFLVGVPLIFTALFIWRRFGHG